MASCGVISERIPTPRLAHALNNGGRHAVLEVANESRFADLPPARIVPMLTDEGVHLASESTFRRHAQGHHGAGD
jgi:putative transposase